MSVTLSAEKNELIRAVAARQGFTDYSINVTTGSMKGDGYLGIINTVDIQDKKDPKRTLHLIIKSALVEEKLREMSPIRKAYEREIFLYTTVFPEFHSLSEETGNGNEFTETARCFGSLLTDQQECLVLENLKELEFKLWNRKLPMNEEHVALVFSTYGKFHGAGFSFKRLKPERYEEVCRNLVHIFMKENETEADKQEFAERGKQIFSNGFRAVANNPTGTQALTKFAQECGKFFEGLRSLDRFSTILHGDCWCNNMMFKYDGDGERPMEMRLLDWQISHVGPPVLDLSYFFYACSSKEVLYKLEEMLEVYHESFKRTVKGAGLDPEEVLTLEELKEQWRKYSRYGLFMSLVVMKVILSEVEEAPDLSELAKAGKDIMESITLMTSANAEAIDKRISDIIVFMCENDYL